MNEQRAHQRIRSYLRGEIVHSGGRIRLECTVRDLSPEGARIQVARDITLPDPFELHIPQRGMAEKSHIVWRQGDETGVHFVHDAAASPKSAAPQSTDRSLLARVETLELELASLRQQMGVMRAKLERFTTERG
ncbi:MAG: PilZ domain-containing protein [Rhizobiales bacterium]|nr:PilZ domain-containing protein [Hyphomicrobiales bacterium]